MGIEAKKKIFLKIIDVDQLDLSEVVDEKRATHVVEVPEKDYARVVEILSTYLPAISLFLSPELGMGDGLED